MEAGVLRPPAIPDAPTAPAPPKRKGPSSTSGPFALLEQIAGMIILTARSTVATVTPPFSWTDEFIEQAWLIIRRCAIPVMVSTTFFGLGAPGLQGGNITYIFGTVDRLGAFFVMASVREFAPWINGMVIAGVGGTAICADLGARKVRQELDALAVLGLDPVRTIVVPRFLALGIVTALMNLVAIVFGVLGGWIAAVVVFGDTTAGYLSTFTSNFTMPDLIGSVVKTSLFGFIIAVVCCYKGMHVKGGAEGVGRAVNQAVVISFVAIWAFNFLFTTTMLAAFPETGNLH
ncbi:MlaE family ABC transporter permease [Patulibacter defluvii]|uniref:MlaE family ABC transporter permease n=1 Tax=Patulibacter defluvii TaxID=3095358 RepID=UPI002A755AA2|nr:ABC transporter permease [Patulibacter sp. DM4]